MQQETKNYRSTGEYLQKKNKCHGDDDGYVSNYADRIFYK